MNCRSCSTENQPGARFCVECGKSLVPQCPKCREETLEKARFCHACGTPLEAENTDPGSPATPRFRDTESINISHLLGELSPDIGQAERRQLSVIFADLASFTELSQKLDPEDLNTVVHEYYDLCRAVCERYEGQVANYLGDGVLILYGYPKAHEEDAHRAVRTGLGIVEGLGAVSRRLEQIVGGSLGVRVGVHTGMMITDDQRGGDWLKMALGETLNIAARIQGQARQNSVVVSEATRRLIEGYFNCSSIGQREMKGVEAAMELFEVSHESTARSRLEAVDRASLTPMTGRDGEMKLLLEEWEKAAAGEGRILLLLGEGGIGKSRLVQQLKEHVADLPDTWMTPCQCSPYHQNTTMYPYIDLIERVVLRFGREESARDRLKKIEGMLVQYGFHIPDILPVYGTFHSLPPEAGYIPSPLDPAQQRRKYMDSMIRILDERSQKQPLLFVVEDLHWIDPTSLETLKELAVVLDQHRILVVFTARPDFESPWVNDDSVRTVELKRLAARQIEQICHRVSGKKLPPSVLEQIRMRADGIPLFAEELTKMIIGSDLLEEQENSYRLTRALPALAIPATLQDSLMARLDKLHTVKEIAQVAAVIGRNFKFETIRHILPVDDAVIRHGLEQLVDSELLVRQDTNRDEIYMFSHALIQEAAYQSLTKNRLRRYHHRLAEVIEEHFPETCQVEPQIVAHHFFKAEMGHRALVYLQRAGDIAAARSSHEEAIVHYQRALSLIAKQPNTSVASIAHEIQLLIGLGVSQTALHGYGAEEVEKTYSRARDLSEQIGDAGQLFRARYGLWRLRMLRAEYDTAISQGEELLELAHRHENKVFLIAAHRALGSTLFYRGHFQRSLQHIDAVIELTANLDAENQTPIRDVYDVVDPRVTCRSYRAWLLWMHGFPDQAREESEKAIALADHLQHPFSQALALSFATWLYQFVRDADRVLELSDRAIVLSQEYGFTFWVGWGQILRGWAKGRGPEPSDSSVEEMVNGLEFWKEKGSALGGGFFLSLLAETHLKRNEYREALEALDRSDRFVNQRDERYWETERLRLRGEVLDKASAEEKFSGEAEAFFQSALDTARQQGALSLELRAATSLARYQLENGSAQAGIEALSSVLEKFSEGENTLDQIEARTLLAGCSVPKGGRPAPINAA